MNKYLYDELSNYCKMLHSESASISDAILRLPSGSLRVHKSGNSMQYYCRDDNASKWTYISKSQMSRAKALAQKSYLRLLLAKLKAEYKHLSKFLAAVEADSFEEIYSSLHEGRRRLVSPESQFVPDRKYIDDWISSPFLPKSTENLSTSFYSDNNEHMRSKSEVLIANSLKSHRIPYKYECPLMLKGNTSPIHPDFTILNVASRRTMYWEHLGMLDDFGYLNDALERIAIYEKNGIWPGRDLIITIESRKNPLNTRIINEKIRELILRI